MKLFQDNKMQNGQTQLFMNLSVYLLVETGEYVNHMRIQCKAV